MEDMLWLLTQASRTLQELRQDIRGVWQDEAARELTSRYLNPHEIEDQQMLTGLKRQKVALDESQSNLVSAEHLMRQTEEKAFLITENLESAQHELQGAYSNYDACVQYDSDARSKHPIVKNLIRQANGACDA